MGSLYSEYTSWLHAWSAGRKLLLMALLGTGLFLIDSPWLLALAGAACGLLWLSLGRATEGARRLMLSVTVAAGVTFLLIGKPFENAQKAAKDAA